MTRSATRACCPPLCPSPTSPRSSTSTCAGWRAAGAQLLGLLPGASCRGCCMPRGWECWRRQPAGQCGRLAREPVPGSQRRPAPTLCPALPPTPLPAAAGHHQAPAQGAGAAPAAGAHRGRHPPGRGRGQAAELCETLQGHVWPAAAALLLGCTRSTVLPPLPSTAHHLPCCTRRPSAPAHTRLATLLPHSSPLHYLPCSHRCGGTSTWRRRRG